MFGYTCHHCRGLICISKPYETRDCSNCGCPAKYTRPWAGKKREAA